MNTKSNLDTLFAQEYDKVYRELETDTIDELDKKSNKQLFFKWEKVAAEINEKLQSITMVRLSGTQWQPDQYTSYLLETHFNNHIGEFVEDPISSYMDEYFDEVKKQFKNTKPSIPQNIKLNKEQTVQLIARHKATSEFAKQLDSIKKDDTMDIYLKKISVEGYKAPSNTTESGTDAYPAEKNDKEQIRKLKQQYTTTRQVLAIQFLFKYAKIQETRYDNTKMAEFIRFLTGRELGATKIRDTTIYKKVSNPFKDKDSEKIEDLRFVKKFFDDMKLGEIVDLINKEIES